MFRLVSVLIGILVCFEISTTFVDIFGCHPIEAAWNKTILGAHCVVPQTLYMATAGINLTTDIIILCIPMPLVWRLRLSTKRKIAVSFIFILGALVCVTTIFRIATFHNINSYDLTWSYIDTAYWTYSELVLSFICACIPTFRPVINHFSSNINRFVSDSSLNRWTSRSRDSSKETTKHPLTTFNGVGLPKQKSKPSKGSESEGYDEIEDSNMLETTVYSKKGTADDPETSQRSGDFEMAIPPKAAHVRSDVHQTN